MRPIHTRTVKYCRRIWPTPDRQQVIAISRVPETELYPYDGPDFVTFLAVENSGELIRRVNWEARA